MDLFPSALALSLHLVRRWFANFSGVQSPGTETLSSQALRLLSHVEATVLPALYTYPRAPYAFEREKALESLHEVTQRFEQAWDLCHDLSSRDRDKARIIHYIWDLVDAHRLRSADVTFTQSLAVPDKLAERLYDREKEVVQTVLDLSRTRQTAPITTTLSPEIQEKIIGYLNESPEISTHIDSRCSIAWTDLQRDILSHFDKIAEDISPRSRNESQQHSSHTLSKSTFAQIPFVSPKLVRESAAYCMGQYYFGPEFWSAHNMLREEVVADPPAAMLEAIRGSQIVREKFVLLYLPPQDAGGNATSVSALLKAVQTTTGRSLVENQDILEHEIVTTPIASGWALVPIYPSDAGISIRSAGQEDADYIQSDSHYHYSPRLSLLAATLLLTHYQDNIGEYPLRNVMLPFFCTTKSGSTAEVLIGPLGQSARLQFSINEIPNLPLPPLVR